MRAVKVPSRLWLTPDWSNWALMTAIVLLVAAFGFYFYVYYAT
jgi:hypothetical protein